MRHKFAVKAQEYFVYFKVSQWICGVKEPSKPADAIVRCCLKSSGSRKDRLRVGVCALTREPDTANTVGGKDAYMGYN